MNRLTLMMTSFLSLVCLATASADDGLDRAIARRDAAIANFDTVSKEADQSLKSIFQAMDDLKGAQLQFVEFDAELDKVHLVLVTKSETVRIEADRQLLIDQCLRQKAECTASQAQCLESRVAQLPCQFNAAIRSYRIGKMLSFFTGMGAGAAIGGGGGGVGLVSASVW